jgi:hypothetical protein
MEELKLAPPSTTFDDRSHITHRYGDTELHVMYDGSPAHTWGHALIYLPQYKILWAGDVALGREVSIGSASKVMSYAPVRSSSVPRAAMRSLRFGAFAAC